MRSYVHQNNIEVTVNCQEGHEELYRDFADKIIAVPMEGSIERDCQNCWVDGIRVRREGYGPKAIYPDDVQYFWEPGDPTAPPIPTSRSKYHQYGSGDTKEKMNLIAFHARMCETKQPERNWPKVKWDKLAANMLKGDLRIASIGHKDQSIHVQGTEDMRGVSLAELTEILSNCRTCYGPSSGPLHLANHCGTDVVWWSANKKDVRRYGSAWNPFEMNNRQAKTGWNPTVEQVLIA